MMVASFDGNTGEFGSDVRLDQRQVKLPCVACNSGWMSQLELDTAHALRRWIGGPSSRLTAAGFAHLQRWMTKTAIVVGFAELGARHILNDRGDVAFPDITLALALGRGEGPNVLVGAAVTKRAGAVWGAGNPTVRPAGPDRISSRAVNVLGLNLGALQLWTALPIISPRRLATSASSQGLGSPR